MPDFNNLMYDAQGNMILGEAIFAAMGQAFFTLSLESAHWQYLEAISEKTTHWAAKPSVSHCLIRLSPLCPG